jgi:acetyl-CoA carboxylase carboxyl transferase subunit alpha
MQEKNVKGSSSASWEKVQIARHPDRPHTLDYINALCSSFVELHGDRCFGDDAALIGGLAQFEGRSVLVLGHQKGHSTQENIKRRFGMPSPEGYRKAFRLMQQAEKFGVPVLSFIDTPGAYPGPESEERGQATAIAESIMAMVKLRTLSIAVIIGEGGSGGALAIGAADRVLMMENAIYSVASPEASASILWHDASLASQAAEAMKITAADLLTFHIIDEIVSEPPDGAHADPRATMIEVRAALVRHVNELEAFVANNTKNWEALLQTRYSTFRKFGIWQQ